ncbi:MAG: hypothetical protein K2K54_05155 [Lachnospiraceae bacterium]|nr:hypothetical protein [Lachnospiraceae bacterium]
MGKKNPFVTTIGFNRHDPAHVEVAQFLNGMERGKAQYIVDAVMAYQNGGQAGCLVSIGRPADYAVIRQIVLQVMEERENGAYGSNTAVVDAAGTVKQPETGGADEIMELDDEALGGILQSLEAFKG